MLIGKEDIKRSSGRRSIHQVIITFTRMKVPTKDRSHSFPLAQVWGKGNVIWRVSGHHQTTAESGARRTYLQSGGHRECLKVAVDPFWGLLIRVHGYKSRGPGLNTRDDLGVSMSHGTGFKSTESSKRPSSSHLNLLKDSDLQQGGAPAGKKEAGYRPGSSLLDYSNI
uniref:Uncharacterized protein n=1 Tax=Timema poppense TaxID=170557 RepID=A0A7R9H8V9_TIMPO|nr:unnamed protein product [Timema poppensis]